jgi:hypothetical protein
MHSAWFHHTGWELGGFLTHRELGSRPKINTPISNSSAPVRIESRGRSNETANATEPVLDSLTTRIFVAPAAQAIASGFTSFDLTLILNPQHQNTVKARPNGTIF